MYTKYIATDYPGLEPRPGQQSCPKTRLALLFVLSILIFIYLIQIFLLFFDFLLHYKYASYGFAMVPGAASAGQDERLPHHLVV